MLVELMAWMAVAFFCLPLQSLALHATPFAGSVGSRALNCDVGIRVSIAATPIVGSVAVAGIGADAVERRE